MSEVQLKLSIRVLTLAQMYQGQFQKHEPAPFAEQDIEPTVISEEGSPMAPLVVRAALQRSTAKLLVHAGFEEYQPAALDAITEMAGDYFKKLARTLNEYSQAPQVAIPAPNSPGGRVTFKARFTTEEIILHTLQENGADLDALDSYVTEEVDRAGSKLAVTHERMKAHLAESLRPALTDAGPDGVNAFNDNSEQFVGGDFAEELGEDFFGFKDLGLDKEFNMASLSVPLHLLQNRMRSANQAQNPRYFSNIFTSCIWILTSSARSPPPLSLISHHHHHLQPSQSTTSRTKSVWCSHSSLPNSMPITTSLLSKTTIYLRSNVSPNRGYHRPGRSRVRANDRSRSKVLGRVIRGKR